MKDIVTIFYEPLAKVYKAANIADSLGDLQTFLNDLIKTVELAEEGKSFLPLTSRRKKLINLDSKANLVEPQRTVQIFVDLVARHESRFYHFVHQVHSKGEGLFDNLMKWIELFINFVRDGLPSPVSLETLLPHAGQERKDVLAEVDAIIEYHRKLKSAHHERMRKRMIKGESSEADADTAFVTGVMDNLHIGAVMGDVADVAAEDSEEDEEEEEGSSDEDVDAGGKPLPPRPGGLQPIFNKSRKKDRVPIVPPKLTLVPRLGKLQS